jgi:hypothetical protein
VKEWQKRRIRNRGSGSGSFDDPGRAGGDAVPEAKSEDLFRALVPQRDFEAQRSRLMGWKDGAQLIQAPSRLIEEKEPEDRLAAEHPKPCPPPT